jgi:membrane protein YqaA with SNARE-associated domain
MSDLMRLMATVIVAAVLGALLVYGLGIVGEEAISVDDAAKP